MGHPPDTRLDGRVLLIAGVYAAGLIGAGVLRMLSQASDAPPAWTGYSTEAYVVMTVLAAGAMRRVGVPLQQFGFGPAFRAGRFILLAALGVALVHVLGWALEPFWERFFAGGRDLGRFRALPGDTGELVRLLALSWTVAAFGEELAFRILLLRGIAFGFGDDRRAAAVALVLQALIFGLVHLYQGPAGVLATTLNGLVYGGLVLAARGSIWPAVLAHGTVNTIGLWRLYAGA